MYHYFLGLDPSVASTGWALYKNNPSDEPVIHVGVLRTVVAKGAPKNWITTYERARDQVVRLLQLLKTEGVSFNELCVVFETALLQERWSGGLCMVGGLLFYTLESRGSHLIPKSPNDIRRLLNIRSKIDKSDTLKMVVSFASLVKLRFQRDMKDLDPEKLDHNEADATLWLLFGLYNYQGGLSLPKGLDPGKWLL